MDRAITRVISQDDVKREALTTSESEDHAMTDSNQETPHSKLSESSPALVERDMDVDFNYTPRSSLSDMSAAHSDVNDETDEAGTEEAQGSMQQGAIGQQTVVHLSGGKFPSSDAISVDSSSASMKGSSQNSSRDWGWFEDVHTSELPLSKRGSQDGGKDENNNNRSSRKKKGKKAGLVPSVANPGSSPGAAGLVLPPNAENEAAAMAVTAPTYVLEESLSSQKLWKYTAGQRPPQPVEERAFFEKMWAQNFAHSQVEYQLPVEVLTAATPISLSPFADSNFDAARGNDLTSYNLVAIQPEDSKPQNVAEAALVSRLNDPRSKTIEPHSHLEKRKVKGMGNDGDLTVLYKGDNVFGTTVSKSFSKPAAKGGFNRVDTVNISIASYRVVESKKHGKFAQFLVIYREGGIRDMIGVWKRHSHFRELSKKVTQSHEGCALVIAGMSPLAVAEEHEVEHLPNAITSWRLLKKRQPWYRCLDEGYLSLKVFLLERFLHDILFESSTPDLLREFVGASE